MMLFNDIGTVAHKVEDLFYYLREQKPQNVDCSTLSDLVLVGVDFIKIEIAKIKCGEEADGEALSQIEKLKEFMEVIKYGDT